MDLTAAEPVPSNSYRCPGESYDIDRAVHLGRLTAFYPACRECPRRDETHSLSTGQVRQLRQFEARPATPLTFAAEGLDCSPNDLDRPTIGRLMRALAERLWSGGDGERAKVIVGADGHPQTASFVADACEELAVCGCEAIEAGAVTTASLAALASREHAHAALRFGNRLDIIGRVDVRFFGVSGRPWSLPGSLAALAESFACGGSRPRRRGGACRRGDAASAYLSVFENLLHGLRPLEFVLDTTCAALRGYLNRLLANSACKAHIARGRAHPLDRQVRESGADFGIWIDGDGEACRVIDDVGRLVEAQRLGQLLTDFVGSQAGEQSRQLAVLTTATCEESHSAVEASRDPLSTDPSGRLWYAGDWIAADAPLSLCLLLNVLSQSDRRLGEVLDECS